MSRASLIALEYIRDQYKVPAYPGVKVKVYEHEGVIVGGYSSYLVVRHDDNGSIGNYHPTDNITYFVVPMGGFTPR